MHARPAEYPSDDQHFVCCSREGPSAGICNNRVHPIRTTRCAWRQRPLRKRRPWRSAKETAKTAPEGFSSCLSPLHLVCVTFYLEHKLLITSRPCFAGPHVTSVGGTTSALPEVAAELSMGDFSNYFPRPDYQNVVIPVYLRSLGGQYQGLYKCVFYCDVIQPILTF